MTSPQPRQAVKSAVRRLTESRAASAAAIMLAVLALSLLVSRTGWFDTLRERAFDALLSANVPAANETRPRIVVVDIDRAALETHGPWPWSREKLAQLLDELAAAKPIAVGLDVLFDGPDEQSPAALARKLARAVADPAVAKLAQSLPDGDARIVASMGAVPTVLGALLDPGRETAEPMLRPILARNAFDPTALWQEAGVIAPPEALRDAAAGIGIIAVPGDADGNVRRIPILVVGGSQLVPGLATELARIAKAAPLLAVDGKPRSLLFGSSRTPLSNDGMLRLVPGLTAAWQARTLTAGDVLSRNPGAIRQLASSLVLVGSSAPEVGGLRSASNGDLAPSVQLQADAVAQLLAGIVPLRPALLGMFETAALALAILAAGVFGMSFAPARGALATAALIAFWMIAAILAARWRHLLVDPLLLPSSAAATFTATAILTAAQTLRRETAIRHRFEQHLAPAVVQQIINRPDALKLAGEVREITAFFTDVEGFTAMTDRAEPHQLIEVLDAYFDEMSSIVVAHGGLVDKIVGDAVHAIFNAPFDLPDHPSRALDCALAVEAFSRTFRERALPKQLGFGMTRIGFETGPAIVGDVGGSRKLDYTAHGNAMNAAARLEAANKQLGTAIAIGPGAAARLPADQLRPLGLIEIRGRSDKQNVFTTWPAAFDRDIRSQLIAIPDMPPGQAVAALEVHLQRFPQDEPARRQIQRLRDGQSAAAAGM